MQGAAPGRRISRVTSKKSFSRENLPMPIPSGYGNCRSKGKPEDHPFDTDKGVIHQASRTENI